MISNSTEWFQTSIGQLENDQVKSRVLCDMKSLVLNSEKSVLSNIVRNVSIQPLFECLNSTNPQETDSLCIVIFELLSQLEPNELLNMYGKFIHNSLIHRANEAKQMGLRLMEKSINKDTVEYIIEKQTLLLIDAAECLTAEERSVAQCSISLFVKLGNNPRGASVLYSDVLLKKLKEVMKVDDISRFRVFEMVLAISKLSAENLEKAVSCGLMGELVTEVFSPDILIQLNALEILSSLASSNHGLSYLSECDVIKELMSKLLKIESEPFSLILLPGLIEFFGVVCAQQPQKFATEYPEIMALLLDSIETGDESLMGVIVSTVGKIGSTCSGRLVLAEQNEKMKKFFTKITQFLSNKNNLTITVLNSLNELLKFVNDDSCFGIPEKWFELMGPNAIETIVNLGKLPFVEFRISALTLLKTIASHSWGALKLYNFPGMVEYLLDRSSEFNKDCKQTKFEVVYNIVNCQNVEEFIGPDVLFTLNEFVKEGPFYVPIEIETATEGAN